MDMPGTWLVTDFNPLIPNGMRRLFRYRVNDVILFQSTHPKRDETTCCLGCLIPCIYFNPLIPNGMRRVRGLYRGKVRHFNPLIPNGMRRFEWPESMPFIDNFNPLIPNGMRLYVCIKLKEFNSYFNPLIPNGMRPTLPHVDKHIQYFNPLIPNGMRP